MTLILIILFGLTMMGGAYLLSYVLSNKNTPKGIALIHGSLGGLALIILSIASFYYHKLFYILILFIITAIGGAVLIAYDLYGKQIPKVLALGHALMAIIGFIALVLLYFQWF